MNFLANPIDGKVKARRITKEVLGARTVRGLCKIYPHSIHKVYGSDSFTWPPLCAIEADSAEERGNGI